MAIHSKDLLSSILKSFKQIEYISAEDIPNIDLYMDQVTTFMDSKLRSTVRHPEEDKILTKTMINNYAKNDLLPPPMKKKYSKEHVLLLIFIYYYKSVLSINDIQTLLRPITEKYFHNEKDFNLENIYNEVFAMEKAEIEYLQEDMVHKFEIAEKTFADAPEEDKEFLHKFAFICLLSYDVYMKKMLLEKLVDDLADSKTQKPSGKREHKKNTGKEESAEEK